MLLLHISKSALRLGNLKRNVMIVNLALVEVDWCSNGIKDVVQLRLRQQLGSLQHVVLGAANSLQNLDYSGYSCCVAFKVVSFGFVQKGILQQKEDVISSGWQGRGYQNVWQRSSSMSCEVYSSFSPALQ